MGNSPDTNQLSLVFAGDIMGHDSQISAAYDAEKKSYNYEPTFRFVKDYISSVDIAIANLEVTLAGEPYKGYPQFSSPDELARAAKNAGFDVFITANNHSLDRGSKGLTRTIAVLDSTPIIHTGTFIDSVSCELNYPLILEKNSIRLALLNYTYGTNGLTIKPPYMVNRINKPQIKKDLLKAQLAEPDFIIVTLHWGIEYERAENSNQRQIEKFLYQHGTDIIIGSHPHVVQPVQMYFHEKDSSLKNLTVFSLGNYVSNQRSRYRDGGIMFRINITKTDSIVYISDCVYLPTWVYRQDGKKSTFYIVPASESLAGLIHEDVSDKDEEKRKTFYKDTREHLKSIPEESFYQDKKKVTDNISNL